MQNQYSIDLPNYWVQNRPMMIKIQKVKNFEKLPLLTRILTTWFGFGLIKPASGTWGSMGGLLFFYGLYILAIDCGFSTTDIISFIVPFSVFLFFLGTDKSDEYERVTGRKDCAHIVIDEVVALWLVLAFVLSVFDSFWIWSVIAFALFRLFDIAKPFPIDWVEERTTGGFGVMIDDIGSAVYTVIVLLGLDMIVQTYFV